MGQNWSPRGDSFTEPRHGYSLAGEDSLLDTHWTTNSTRLLENVEDAERLHGQISNGTSTVQSVENVSAEVKNNPADGMFGLLPNNTEVKDTERSMNTETLSPLLQDDKSKTVTHNPQTKFRPTKAPLTRLRPTKEPNPDPREFGKQRDNKTPGEARDLPIVDDKVEREKDELLLLHKRLDQEKEMLKQQQMKQEEERQKEKERDHHSHNKHHHHLHTVTAQTPGKRLYETPTVCWDGY